MMRYLIFMLLILALPNVAHAEDKKAKPKPPHASFPVGMGGQVEKLPDVLSSEDQKDLLIVDLSKQNDELTKKLLETQQLLMQCQEKTSTSEREKKRKAILDKYRTNENDRFEVQPDGTIRIIRAGKK